MTLKVISLLAFSTLAIPVAIGQTSGAPKTAPKAVSPVEAVIQMVKAGLSEPIIIKKLVKDNKPIDLSPADMVKLKQAGVSDGIMAAMMDPASAATPAAAPPPPTAPAAPAPPIESAAPPAAAAPASDPPAATAPAASAPPPTEPAAAAPPTTGSVSTAPTNAEKKRVVIDAFDYSAVMTQVQAIFGTQQNIGQGIQAMLTNDVTKSGKLIVVERQKLQQVKDEQDVNMGSRNKQGVGARTGRIRGADAILAGNITIFGRDDKQIGGKGGGCSKWDFRCGAAGFGLKKDKAIVAITYRLIDAETSEVIATGEARGESKRTGVMGSGGGGDFWGKHGGGAFDMTSSNFQETIIGEATKACVDKLADILTDQATTMKRTVREVETSVVDFSAGIVTIGAGENDGVAAGDIFDIHHVLKILKDPQTQEVLDRKTEVIGQLTITSVRPRIAVGTYSGAPPAATTDYIAIKRMPAQQ